MAQTVGYLQFTEYIRVPAPTVINTVKSLYF